MIYYNMDTKLIENLGNLPVELRSKFFSFGAVQHPLAEIFNKDVKVLDSSECCYIEKDDICMLIDGIYRSSLCSSHGYIIKK